MNSLSQRASVRQYQTKEVSEALIADLLEQAERTQTMANLQLYSVVETRSPERKKALSPLHFNQPMVESAPVALTFCADYHRVTEWCKQRGAAPGFDNLLSFINAAADALLYCQTFCALAEEKGLGLCFLGTTYYHAREISRLLELPPLVIPVATITLGWPAETPRQTDRLPLSAILHKERYRPVTAEAINSAYAEKERLPENIAMTKEAGKETLAQVYAETKYTKANNEAFSSSLWEALKEQGFFK